MLVLLRAVPPMATSLPSPSEVLAVAAVSLRPDTQTPEHPLPPESGVVSSTTFRIASFFSASSVSKSAEADPQ